ncbi:type VII secretion protein EccB [Mycobacterium sp. Soil538]|nr:type VII secretion protein EccB [Mycobacterium sp. Soil538]
MRQPTTRLQVSGHRFLVRRMEHALVRGDAGMLDDPLRAQSMSLAAGAVLTAVAVAACAVLAVFRPAGDVGDAAVVMVRESGALYVRVDDTLHPVPNLTSAWLIAGNAAPPRVVAQDAVDRARRGAQMGIPGAPQHIPAPMLSAESSWTVCDDGTATTVIAGPLADGVAPPERGVLVRPLGAGAALTYLLYGGRRARVDLRHPAVVRALHLDHVEPQLVSPAVLSAIPEAPAIAAPHIPDRGTAGPVRLRDRPVGTVVAVPGAGRGPDLFVVLAGGLQRVGEVAADLIRYTDERVGEVAVVSPDLVGELPVVDTLPVGTYPHRAGVSRASAVCARWQPAPGGSASHTSVLVGDTVPVRDGAVTLAQADGPGPAVDAVAVPRGRSAFVQSVALGSGPDSVGPLFLLTDAGVLFGLENTDTAARLGLPLPAARAPWPVLAVLPRGPDLSNRAASTRRDVVAARP